MPTINQEAIKKNVQQLSDLSNQQTNDETLIPTEDDIDINQQQ